MSTPSLPVAVVPRSLPVGQKHGVRWVHPRETQRKIDWDCPCLDGVRAKPCGELTIAGMKCFSENENDFAKCHAEFEAAHRCMEKYPEEYADVLKGPPKPAEVPAEAQAQ
jgi:hypothetical protein